VPTASFTLRIKNTGDVQKAIAAFKDRATPAIVRALNRSGVSAQTVMRREVSNDMGLRQKDVPISTEKATGQNLTATVIGQGKRIALMDFSARETKRSGVRAKLPTGAGKYPHAFIRTMPSGHRGVFQRKPGSRRLPIYELYGPSIPHVFMKHADTGMARGQEQLIKNLTHELRFALAQIAA
jgi:hypothetical protein